MCGTTISATANGDDNDNNQFLFNRVIKARYGIVTRGTTTNLNISPVVADNIVGPTAFGTDQIGKVGIFMQADTGALVTRNVVQTVGCLDPQACTGADRMGISIGNESWSMAPGTITSNNYTVTRNVVRDIVEELTFSAMGINLATTGGGSVTNNLVANNFIYNVRANGTSGDQAVGLGIAGGLGDRVVFNSISMTGDVDPLVSAASTNFGSGIRVGNASGSTHGNLTLSSNSVYMDLSSSSTATLRFYAISGPANTFNWGTGGENYNNLYINPSNTQLQTGGLGTTAAGTLTTQFATLANWQTAYTTPAAQDANSIQADPLYISNTADLHIAVGSPNVNAGNAVSGLTRDIDNQNRVGVFDIGADEPSGVTPPANDIEASSILVPANGTAFATGATATPQARFTNVGSATVTSRQVTFSITGPGGYNYSNNQTIASIAVDEAVNVTFASAPAFTTAGTYTMTASTAADSNTANDSVGGSFAAYAPFSGSYNVGSAETFTSLTNPGGIFAGINAAGATGNVTINITSDLTGETGVVLLNEIASGFNVLIKPSGAARTISGNSGAAGLLGFNGTDGVTIDGSLSGGTDRSLTISPTQIANSGGGIYFGSGATGAQNNVVKNVNVYGNGATIGALLGIAFGSSTTFGGLGLDNDNNRVENCDIRGAFYGIASLGASAANKDIGLVITKNTFSGTGTAGIGRIGIYVIAADGAQVTANNIASVSNPGSVDTIGIAIGGQAISSAPLTSGTISNAIIARNYVGVVSNNATFSAAGIVLISDVTGTNRVQNNMVTGVIGNSNAGDIVAGIYVNGLAGSVQNVYHNSVSMTGDRGSATANMLPSYALAIATDQPTNVVNNALFNSQTRTGSTGGGGESYAIGFDAPAASVTLVSNYNDLLVSGPIGVVGITGDLITAAQTTTAGTGTNQATLAAWQTATTEDANSLSVNPLFTSLTDLHIPSGSPLVNVGTDVGVTVDFDDQLRDAMRDIGADEFVVIPTADLSISKTDGVTTANPGGGVVYTIVASNAGPDPVTGATVTDTFPAELTASWTCVGAGGGTCTAAGSGNINDTVNLPLGASVTYTATAAISASATGTLTNTTTVAVPGGVTDPNTPNNTATDVDTLVAESDLSITKTDGVTTVTAGGSTTYTIVASNAGPSNTTATVADTFPAAITSVNWTCVGAGGGTCTAAGSGNINDAVNLPAGGSVTYTAVSAISGMASGSLINSATVTGVAFDPNSPNNTATDTDTITAGASNVTVTASAGTPTANYATLKDAIDAINGGTHQGVITVAVNANTTETAPSVLNSSGAGSALYTSITIRPSADGVTVAGPTATGRGLIELNGADNVIIDGDNPGTAGTNRNLTLQNTAANTITFTSVIRVALNISTVSSADNNVFRNLNIVGSSSGRNIVGATSTTASENTTFGIFLGPNASDATTAPTAITSVATGVGTGATASNLVVQNNNVLTAARAVSINGAATTVAPGLQILGNEIGNPTAGNADQVTAIGIAANGSANAVVSGNTIWVEGYVRASASNHAISIGVNSANTTGAIIENNRVNRVRNNDLQTWTAMGINLGGGNNHIVRNNFVSGVINDQTGGTGSFGTSFGAYGIRVGSGTGHQIYHNSVNMYGAIPGATNTNLTAAFLIVGTTQTGCDVRNNTFVNAITGGNPTGTRNVAIFLPSGGTSAMNLTLNNNGYFVGADANNRLAQVGATFGTGEFTLANFDPTMTTPATNFRSYSSTLSAAGTNDNASLKVDPLFISNSDLHLQATSPMLELGANAGVTTDIDGDARDSIPDIGADEIAVVAVPGSLQFSSATYSVGEAGPTATITVTRTGGSDGVVGASYATVAGGTATGGGVCGGAVDYVSSADTVVFGNGVTTPQTFTVPICDDALIEGNETVNLALTMPTGGATLGTPNTAVLTINDNDVAVPGTLQFSSATYSVGEAGPTATITVTRTGGSDGTVGAAYATVAGGTATGGAMCGGAVDYVNTSGTVSFGNGVTTPQTFTIPVCDDATVEGAETVNLALTMPTGGATLGTPNTAVLTINDNDVQTYTVAISDAKLNEGNSGSANMTFNVTLTATAPPLGGSIASVQYTTANGTATAGSDYTTTSGTLNFNATGTLLVTVPITGDTNKEANEFFSVNLSSPSGNTTITDGTGYGVIRDEDRSYQSDFDDDLKADYSVHRQSEQRFYVLRSSDGTNLIVNFGAATDVAVPGDYDGDGKTDIALYRPSTSTFYALNSSTNTVKGITVGAAEDKPVQGDYNGDGRTDMATFRPSNGLWSIYFIHDGSTAAQLFGISTDRPVQADYDGDNKTDIAVYRDGTWYILRSSDSAVSISNWGVAADKPVSGDFDGDGRFALAVYRNGQWWVVNSWNGNTSVVAWGLATDIPSASDYDGDGTTDVAIFRPSSGEWIVLRSSDLTITGVKWGVSGDSPVPNRYLPQ
ncbi:MAG TPA: Calx-beta domain-containing protein [Pyrinomonadaceae bacterium]|nr:Calx-beta domain-containing protein [Pyrinomonadaceae bacterium]